MVIFQILKRNVDSYELGKIIPKCQFSANIPLQEGDSIPTLQQRVTLIGTKSPYNFLTFNIEPGSGMYIVKLKGTTEVNHNYSFVFIEHHPSVKRSLSEPGIYKHSQYLGPLIMIVTVVYLVSSELHVLCQVFAQQCLHGKTQYYL